MDKLTECRAGINRRIHTVDIIVVPIRDDVFQLFQLVIKVHFCVFDSQDFPDEIQNTPVKRRISKPGLLTKNGIIRVHSLAQTSREGEMLPAFQFFQP
ncbi:Uncharacterised protein [Klebsiella pneumoniae]|nr:Uncharacterised protein [Klebsiella pneumoniae]